MITSKSNPKLKEIKKISSDAKERKNTRLFVAEGLKMCEEVPPELIESVYFSENGYERLMKAGAALYEKLKGMNIGVVKNDVFESISDTVTPQGVLAVLKQPARRKEDFAPSELFVLLDGVSDPGNSGTILRTAEAAGAGVLFGRGCADIFNPKAVRATMGSIFRVPFMYCDLTEAIERLKSAGIKVYASSPAGGRPYTQIRTEGRAAVVIGNEAHGVTREVLNACDERVFIPMAGKVESLNAAISAAILMYGLKSR